MYRRRSQQGRYRRHPGINAPVRQHQDIGSVPDSTVSVNADGFNSSFQSFRASVHRIEHGKGYCPQGIGLQVLDDRHLFICQQGTLHFQSRRSCFIRIHNVGYVADHHTGRSDDAFPHTVNRRICHLGKILLEIIVQHLGFFRQHRQRRVNPHSPHRIFPHAGHRNDHLGDIFFCIAKDFLLFFEIKGKEGIIDTTAPLFHQSVHFNNVFFAPLPVRMSSSQYMLQLFIFHDALFRCIDQEQFSRLQASLADDLVRRHRHSAGFRAQHDPIVFRHIVTGRAKSVPIQHAANYRSIAEADGCRAVPGFHHKGLVPVKIPFFLAHGRIFFPGFRNHGNHGMGQGMTCHHQILQAVVEHGGIAAGIIHHREHLFHIREKGRLCLAFPGIQPVHVAPDGIDFPVMYDIAVRMGPCPAGKRIGTETGMDQSHGRSKIQIGKVQVKMPQLQGSKHAFIYDST